MNSEKTNEFKALLQKFIEANGESIFGKRIHWKNFPEKIRHNLIKALNVPDGESLLLLFDSSLFGSGKEGMALTDLGVRYNDGVNSWVLTWNDLQEKYAFVKTKVNGALGVQADVLLLKAKPGDDFAVDKEINISMADIDYVLLARILNKTCQLFTGNGIDMQDLPAKQEHETDETQEGDEDIDDSEMKYRVFNYGKDTVSLPYINPINEIQEFQQYIKKAIAANDKEPSLSSESIKSRSILNLGPSNEISALEDEYVANAKIEKLIFFFDVSPDETRDYGVALTNIGINYKFYGERKCMAWKQLAEEYAIRVNVGVEIVEPNGVMDEDADPIMEINLSQAGHAMLAGEWLFDIICKGCDIFTEKEEGSKKVASGAPKEQIGKKSSSILRRNPEGVIMSIIMSVLIFIGTPSVIGFILIPTLSFVGYIIGNKIRLAVHPDFVMASGFTGLLKQKIFWRFIPQLIGCLIGGIIGGGIGMVLF